MTWEEFAERSQRERTWIEIGGEDYQVIEVLDLRKTSLVLLIFKKGKGFSVVKISTLMKKEPPSVLEEGDEHFLNLMEFWEVDGVKAKGNGWEGYLQAKNITRWEYAEGVLGDWIGRADGKQSEEWFLQVMEALSIIHRRGRVHLDVKPSNIFLVGGRAKLGDFDFYSSLQELNARRKKGNFFAGTYGYMAPDFFGKGPVSEKVDIYSAGVTFARLITGLDFPAIKGETPEEYTLRVRELLLRRLQGRKGKLSALLIKMLFLSPGERPSADEVIKSLKGQENAEIEDSGKSRSKKRIRLPLFLLGLLLLALISSGLYFALRNGKFGEPSHINSGNLQEKGQTSHPKPGPPKPGPLEPGPPESGLPKPKPPKPRMERVFLQVKKRAIRLFRNRFGKWEAELPYGIRMVFVKGGKFTAGCVEDYCVGEYNPPHRVEIPSFWISKYEITFSQFDAYCERAYCGTWQVLFYIMNKPPDFFLGRGQNPVFMVSWEDAMNYAMWLSSQLSLPFRLPYQDEWEYAAREGGRWEVYPGFTPEQAQSHAWFLENGMIYPRRVGLKLPNSLGIYDMAGNVLEWCMDDYGYGEKVLKGGTVNSPLEGLKTYLVYHYPIDHRDITTGFRLVIGGE